MNTFLKNPIRKALFVGFSFILLGFLVYPLARLLVVPYFNEHLKDFFYRIIESDSLLKSLRMTFYFSSLATLFSVFFGVVLAWVVTRTNLPFYKQFKIYLSLPYAIPPFIGAISWIYLANPSNGLFNQLLNFKFLNIYSLAGLVFVETSFLYTYAFIPICSALENMDSSFEEAARTAGASAVKTFLKITLPLIKPHLINSSLLVFLASLASFGVPALIASPAGFKVITTEIYQLQKMGTMTGLQTSILLSSFLLLFSMLILFLSQKIKTKDKLTLISGKSSRRTQFDLKNHKPFVFIFLLVFLIVVLVFPFLGLFLSATSRVQGSLSLSNFTLNHFTRIFFETEEIGRAFKNSLLIATTVGFICCFISLILGYALTQTQFKGKKLIELFVAIPYSAPGTVVALALILAFSQNFFGIPISIYNTLWMFMIAYSLKYLNFSFKIVTDHYNQIHTHLIEAAETSGASFIKVFRYIWLPLLKPALMASFFLVFVPSLSELTMSLFLTGPGLETIGTLIFQMQEYSDNIGGGASVLATCVFILVFLMNLLIKKVSNGKYGL